MAKRAYADTRAARFIERRVLELQARKTQSTIAAEAGFPQPNMLAMIKTGATKLPLERVPALAKALECDPAHLFVMAVEQRDSALATTLQKVFGSHVTQNETDWLNEAAGARTRAPAKNIAQSCRRIRIARQSRSQNAVRGHRLHDAAAR